MAVHRSLDGDGGESTNRRLLDLTEGYASVLDLGCGEGATLALLALCNGAIHWYEGKPPREIERLAVRFADYFLNGALPRRA